MAAVAHNFPWTVRVAGTDVKFRLMTPGDSGEVRQFVSELPEEDLFFLMDDPRDPAGMERWVNRVREGLSLTVLAESGGTLIGYGTLRRGGMTWTRHLGEIRLMISPAYRGKGLGKLLAKEVFAVAHDLELRRLIARLTSSQTPARYLFQHLGFHIEALLADCVIDREGRTEDLVFMSYDVAGFHG